ncbi:PaaX family transcriptional regulator C-terminal domain-containing protein [Anderseniella sp. Alg231-50]|uniref:PaaX family transcriptional regulator C-terminal domain-containing protein n=1 Tax=Anderseniella sp. Alg231-50 TaxID=1922226 RepID=UPI000D558060
MTNAAREIERHIDRLHSNGRLRVWSLIITFFGDAVALRGGRVALSTLQDAMGLLNIEPGAVRTALSRLAGEGWVEREREGRLSFYKLTDQGHAAFDEPTRRIYAGAARDWDGEWTVAVEAQDTSNRLSKHGFVALGGKAWLRIGGDADGLPDDLLVISGTGSDLPEPLLSLWKLDEHAAHYTAFISSWQAFSAPGNLSPGEAMAARTLLLHDWRRIVLRDPGLPDALLPAGWIGDKARKLAGQTYHGLLQGSENWLNDNGLPVQTDSGAMQQRFNVLRNIAK